MTASGLDHELLRDHWLALWTWSARNRRPPAWPVRLSARSFLVQLALRDQLQHMQVLDSAILPARLRHHTQERVDHHLDARLRGPLDNLLRFCIRLRVRSSPLLLVVRAESICGEMRQLDAAVCIARGYQHYHGRRNLRFSDLHSLDIAG